MAFQTSHTSSDASATAGADRSSASTSAAANSSSTQTGGVSNPPPLTPSSSSLPFSFLITFVAIFLFFLGCGLGSRRVTRRFRRTLGLDVHERGRGRAALVARERPRLWDVCPVEGKDGGRHAWAHFKPLCASYVRTGPASSSDPSFPSSTSTSTSTHPARARARPTPTPSILTWAPGGMGAMGFALARTNLRTIPNPISRPVPPLPTSPLPPTHPTYPAYTAYPARVRAAPRPPHLHGHPLPGWLGRMLAGTGPGSGPASQPGTGAGADAGGREGAGNAKEHGQEGEQDGREPVQALQVVAVIAMPSRERAARRGVCAKKAEAEVGVREVQEEEEEPPLCVEDWELGEYVLGAARVEWGAGDPEGHGTG